MEAKNKSLSARVRRRNKKGFKGEGTRRFVKKTPYGDYTNDLDNHKHDIEVPERTEAIHVGKKYYFKHMGSKPMKKLLKILHDMCTFRKDIVEVLSDRIKARRNADKENK